MMMLLEGLRVKTALTTDCVMITMLVNESVILSMLKSSLNLSGTFSYSCKKHSFGLTSHAMFKLLVYNSLLSLVPMFRREAHIEL